MNGCVRRDIREEAFELKKQMSPELNNYELIHKKFTKTQQNFAKYANIKL